MGKLRLVAKKAMRDKAFSRGLARDVEKTLARKKVKLSAKDIKILKAFLKRKYTLTGLQLLTFVAIIAYGKPVPPPPLWGKVMRVFWGR